MDNVGYSFLLGFGFGGINFMEFGPGDRVIVNPLRVNRNYLNELQINLLLYNTGQSRFSSDIITTQSRLVGSGKLASLEAMHLIKLEAVKMKEAVLTGRISKIGNIAGCIVKDGIISRNSQIRILRDNVVIHAGVISSLKRFKDEVKEVKSGYECGVMIENYSDIKVGDIIETFEEIKTNRKL